MTTGVCVGAWVIVIPGVLVTKGAFDAAGVFVAAGAFVTAGFFVAVEGSVASGDIPAFTVTAQRYFFFPAFT